VLGSHAAKAVLANVMAAAAPAPVSMSRREFVTA
jgi:hypothetical protein